MLNVCFILGAQGRQHRGVWWWVKSVLEGDVFVMWSFPKENWILYISPQKLVVSGIFWFFQEQSVVRREEEWCKKKNNTFCVALFQSKMSLVGLTSAGKEAYSLARVAACSHITLFRLHQGFFLLWCILHSRRLETLCLQGLLDAWEMLWDFWTRDR